MLKTLLLLQLLVCVYARELELEPIEDDSHLLIDNAGDSNCDGTIELFYGDGKSKR